MSSLDFTTAMSLIPGLPSSFTPPMSPSATRVSNWQQLNVPSLLFSGSSLQSSRLWSSLIAGDMNSHHDFEYVFTKSWTQSDDVKNREFKTCSAEANEADIVITYGSVGQSLSKVPIGSLGSQHSYGRVRGFGGCTVGPDGMLGPRTRVGERWRVASWGEGW
ncbi:hypothetical protein L2E82_36156 [Cichorium intybus]|uniref:Uncharacterized protein n=1 Tax=Cichorium intybus TaxID=13427 RepID=A0ACB9BQR0_CICIN|nr:hypothetical protein L2E82_36156 [Cichorium intybus]